MRPEYLPQQRVEFTVSSRTVVRLLGLVTAFLLLLDAIWSVRQVLTWVLVSIFFAIALHPCVMWLKRRGFGHRTAVMIVFSVTAIGIIGFFVAILAPLYGQLTSFVTDLPHTLERLSQWGPIHDHPAVAKQVRHAARDLPAKLPSSAGTILGLASTVVSAVVNLATVLFLTLFLLLELPTMVEFAMGVLPPERAERLASIQREINQTVSRYVAANLFVSVICATVTGVSLYLLGVPYVLVLALLSGFFDIVPLIGATVGGVIVCLVAFAHSTTAGIVMIVVYNVYQQVENHIIQPVVMRKSVQVSPFITLVSVLVGSTLLGLIGALLAIPAAASVQIALRQVVEERRRRVDAARELIDDPDSAQSQSTHRYITTDVT